MDPSSFSEVESNGETTARSNKLSKVIYAFLLVALLAVIGWFYAGVVDHEIIGFTHDDGVYLSTSKALATGQGFKLLHVVGHPPEVKYPFMYPILLVPIWLLFPHFPQNVPIFSYLSIAFTLGAFALLYTYLRRAHRFPGWLALLTIVLTASNFFFIYFSTTVMAEAPYLFFSLLTLCVFHRFSKNNQVLSTGQVLRLIVLSAITTLTRMPGVALVAAIGVWLLLARQWKNALLYGIGAFVLGILPWSLWIKLNTPALTDLNYALVFSYSNYGLEFVQNYFGGKSYWTSLADSTSSFLNRLVEMMFPLSIHIFKLYPALQKFENADIIKQFMGVLGTYVLAGYFLIQGISACTKSFANKFSTKYFSVSGLYLFFYIAVILLWNYEDQMARFLVVVTPILWLHFFKPALPFLQHLRSKSVKAWSIWILLIALSVMSLWPIQNSYRLVYRSRIQHWVDSGALPWLWGDYQASFQWIQKNTPKGAVLATNTDDVFYLYTGRPTYYLYFASLRRSKGRFFPNALDILMKSMEHYGVQYIVAEPYMQARSYKGPMNPVVRDLLVKYPKRFQMVYITPHRGLRIYKLLK